jgi:hypothetical protein
VMIVSRRLLTIIAASPAVLISASRPDTRHREGGWGHIIVERGGALGGGDLAGANASHTAEFSSLGLGE